MQLFAWIFFDAWELSGRMRLLLLLPLCLAIAIVYKATRLERLEDLYRAVPPLWLTMVVGMYGIGVLLYVLYQWVA